MSDCFYKALARHPHKHKGPKSEGQLIQPAEGELQFRRPSAAGNIIPKLTFTFRATGSVQRWSRNVTMFQLHQLDLILVNSEPRHKLNYFVTFLNLFLRKTAKPHLLLVFQSIKQCKQNNRWTLKMLTKTCNACC